MSGFEVYESPLVVMADCWSPKSHVGPFGDYVGLFWIMWTFGFVIFIVLESCDPVICGLRMLCDTHRV